METRGFVGDANRGLREAGWLCLYPCANCLKVFPPSFGPPSAVPQGEGFSLLRMPSLPSLLDCDPSFSHRSSLNYSDDLTSTVDSSFGFSEILSLA